MNALTSQHLLDSTSLTSATFDAKPKAAYVAFWEAHHTLSQWNQRNVSLSDAQAEELGSRWHDALSAIADHPAGTLAELRDKAKVMVAAFEFDVPSEIGAVMEDNTQPHELIAWKLAHDLLASGKRSSMADQDAGLIADIARATELHNGWYALYEASRDAVGTTPETLAEREHWSRVEPEWNDLKGRIYATRPNASKGLLAKARFFVDCLGAGESDSEQSLICDILDANGHFGLSVPAGSPPSTMHTIGLRLGEIDREIVERRDQHHESLLETERQVLERAILSQAPLTAGDAVTLQLVALSYVGSLADGCEPRGESFADRATWVGQAIAAGLRTLASATGVNLALMGESYYISGPLSPEEGEPPARPPFVDECDVATSSIRNPEIEPNDYELLALCDEFTALEDAYSATFHKGNPAYIRDERKREKANDPRVKRQEEIAPVIAATPAHTDAGVIAKLRSFAKWDKEILKPDYPGNMAEIILGSACRDVMRGAGA